MDNIKKTLLRKIMLMRQKSLSESYVKRASKNMQTQILSSQLYKEAKKIFIYISMPQEPSTIEIINHAFSDGKEVYVPKCIDKDMFAVRIYDLKNLIPAKFEFLEPEDTSDTLEAKDFDLIIAPCVAASLDGKRLGHGAGYYDKFLAGAKENQNIICLCFYKMLSSNIPMEEHDFYMPEVLTEKNSFKLAADC